MESDSNSINILKCGVRFEPPALVIIYQEQNNGGKLRRHTIPLRRFNKHSDVTAVVEELGASGHYVVFIKRLPTFQLHRLLSILRDKLSGLSLEASVVRNNELDTIQPDEDLNTVEQEVLIRKKLHMDSVFDNNRICPSSPNFIYDVDIDFGNSPMETSEWDLEDDVYEGV